MEKVFTATIMVAIKANEQAEACDALTAMLTENLMQSGSLIDWQYTKTNGRISQPEFKGEYDLKNIDEGEILNS